EEIFGPVLPILTFETIEQVIPAINARPKPLALYLFSNNRKTQNRITSGISYGGGCINDTLIHLATPHLPFGGVGDSGMGNYHGKASFDGFSHHKSVLTKSFWFDNPFRYPPFKGKLKLVKKIMG
ncbi:MAG: aldehyde dehydrogenase family protein, partial [bacterium]